MRGGPAVHRMLDKPTRTMARVRKIVVRDQLLALIISQPARCRHHNIAQLSVETARVGAQAERPAQISCMEAPPLESGVATLRSRSFTMGNGEVNNACLRQNSHVHAMADWAGVVDRLGCHGCATGLYTRQALRAVPRGTTGNIVAAGTVAELVQEGTSVCSIASPSPPAGPDVHDDENRAGASCPAGCCGV